MGVSKRQQRFVRVGSSHWGGQSHTCSITDLEPNPSKIHPPTAVNNRTGTHTMGSKLHVNKYCLSRSSLTNKTKRDTVEYFSRDIIAISHNL